MTELRRKTCCFTGHREIPLNQIETVRIKVRNSVIGLIHEGYLYFGAGGALGFDTLCAQVVLELKNEFPQIKLILVLPCRSQTNGWKQEDVAIYGKIMQQADKVVYTSDNYFRGCMHKRNRHLVDNSSACICYLTKSSGGTFYTVNYACQKGLSIISVGQ